MKTAKKRFIGIPRHLPSADSISFAGDTGVFLLLTLSLIAAGTLALCPLVSGEENWERVLMHGMVMLNGGAN